jgi:hypothetical protein
MLLVTNNSEKNRWGGTTPGIAALRLCPKPVTLTPADPIVAVGTPFRVTEPCAPDASIAKVDRGEVRPEDPSNEIATFTVVE